MNKGYHLQKINPSDIWGGLWFIFKSFLWKPFSNEWKVWLKWNMFPFRFFCTIPLWIFQRTYFSCLASSASSGTARMLMNPWQNIFTLSRNFTLHICKTWRIIEVKRITNIWDLSKDDENPLGSTSQCWGGTVECCVTSAKHCKIKI